MHKPTARAIKNLAITLADQSLEIKVDTMDQNIALRHKRPLLWPGGLGCGDNPSFAPKALP